ncbi:MAG: ribosome silencing factor [Planctomycetes bacterium]|nr:ribosome silencing factor [Planctomycetota bacterium]MBL7106932.1 ribosome silencing factor [Phycisphaerae bacterium]
MNLKDKKTKKTKDFAIEAAKIAFSRHCTDVIVLDLKGKSPATDFFVIATGTSARQIKSVSDEINEEARKNDFQRFGRAGYEQGQWVLLDYVDVVVHLFDEKYRNYYDLELLWGDAEKTKIA